MFQLLSLLRIGNSKTAILENFAETGSVCILANVFSNDFAVVTCRKSTCSQEFRRIVWRIFWILFAI